MSKMISLSPVKRIVTDGMLCGAALMLSYIEAVIPLGAVIPLPGFKLGLANAAVMPVFFGIGAVDGIMVSLVRVVVSTMLFGSAASFIYSLSGALAAVIAMWLVKRFFASRLSYYGAGMLSAAFHNTAQCAAASLVLGSTAVFSYAPVLLVISVITGFITGMISALCFRVFKRRNYL